MPDPLTVLDAGDEIAGLLAPFYPRLLELAFADAGEALDVEIAFTLDNPAVQDCLDQLARRVKGVAATTRDTIRALVGQAAAEGWDMPTLAQAIRDAGVTESARRSQMIARTESATAYTQGSLLAYKESGVVDQVEWLIGDDACAVCAGLAGQRVPLGTPFPGGFDGPPAHVDCRCAVSPVLGQE